MMSKVVTSWVMTVYELVHWCYLFGVLLYDMDMSDKYSNMIQRHGFVRSVENAMRDECGVKEGDRLLVGVSGGADSMALLRAMVIIGGRGHWGLEICVGHVQHHLREEAEAEAEFVRELADEMGLWFGRRDVDGGGGEGNVESNAREMRYDALEEMAKELDADGIVTGHHGDDQIETMLMRIIRGSGLVGMCGIAACRELGRFKLLRPMLGVDHAGAVEFLKELGQNWCEDATNKDMTRVRAKLRDEVLPIFREIRSDAASRVNDTARQLQRAAIVENERIVEVEREYVEIGESGESRMSREAARGVSSEVFGGIVRRRCVAMGGDSDKLGWRKIDGVVCAARDSSGESRRFEMGSGVKIDVLVDAIIWRL